MIIILVSEDVILTYINEKGMTLSMSFFNKYFLLECVEQLQNNISGERLTGYSGEMFTNMAADVRHIELTGFFDSVQNRRVMEGELKKVFNVGCAGILEYYHRKDRKRYTIKCFAEKMPEVVFVNARVEFTVNLKCLDPFWYGEEITIDITESPFTFENAGDSAAGAVFEFTGTADEPVVSNGDRKIAYMGSLTGQTLRITSMPDKTMAEVDGVNVIRRLTDITRRSFFLLDIGTNTIGYDAKSGADSLSVKLRYKPRYLGTF